MATPIKAVSHAPEDIHILGGESLVYRVAACGGNTTPNVSINTAGAVTSYKFDDVPASADYAARVTTSTYGALVNHSVGVVTARATATCTGFASNTVSSKINVFDAIEDANVIEVTNSSELALAFVTINSGTDSHYLISMSAGTYTLAGIPAITRDNVLLSIEPDNNAINQVYITDGHGGVPCNSKKAFISWRSLIFDGTGNDAVMTVTKNTTQVFRNCKFSNAPVGLRVQPSSTSRAVSCHTTACDTGFIGVNILRSCSGAGIRNNFSVDCGVVDGSLITTYATDTAAIYYSESYYDSICVLNNTLVEQGTSPFLYVDGDTVSSQIKGNVYNGGATGPAIRIKGIYDTSFVHNTINGGSDAVEITNGAKNLRVINNWLAPLTRKANKMTQFDSVWTNNATSSDVSFPNTLTNIAYPFSNNYMFLRKRTPVRTDGLQPSQLFSQGAKVQPGQIGALPFTSDTDLTSVHKSVYERPFFSFSGPAPSTN